MRCSKSNTRRGANLVGNDETRASNKNMQRYSLQTLYTRPSNRALIPRTFSHARTGRKRHAMPCALFLICLGPSLLARSDSPTVFPLQLVCTAHLALSRTLKLSRRRLFAAGAIASACANALPQRAAAVAWRWSDLALSTSGQLTHARGTLAPRVEPQSTSRAAQHCDGPAAQLSGAACASSREMRAHVPRARQCASSRSSRRSSRPRAISW